MRTKIGTYLESLIESGWLLALVSVPLFFNVYSARVFEPDKLGLLRTIATLVAVAIVAVWLEYAPTTKAQGRTWRQRLGHAWRYPLVRPTVLLLAAYLLATALSVAPRVSLWGSYQRLQGTYTLLGYVILFGAVLLFLRRKEQAERLCMAAILVSLPVALYGLVQHSGLDPLPWGGDVTQRVASTLGNAIFVGAYLAMVIPLTAARWIEMVRRMQAGLPLRTRWMLTVLVLLLWGVQLWAWISLGVVLGLWLAAICLALLVAVARAARRPAAPFALAGCYSLILAAQCVTLLFSGSRGPQVGLLGGLLLAALLYAATRHRRAVLTAVVGVGLLVAGGLIVINLPDSPLSAVRELPYVGRLGRLLELEEGTGRVRVLIWQGAVEMLTDDPARALVGYGPETMYVAYNPYYPAELAHYEARNASPDRSHNETFDALITTGALGLAAWLALYASVFYQGFRALGLLPDRRSHILFGACLAVGGLVGALAPRLLEGTWRLSGVGLPLGMIVGLAAHVVLQALLRDMPEPALEGWLLLLMIALLAGLAAHWIEISVGIAIAATRTHFWIYAALVALLAQGQIRWEDMATEASLAEGRLSPGRTRHARHSSRRGRVSVGTAPEPRSRQRIEQTQLAAGALLVALVLCLTVWNYTMNPLGESNALGILITSLTYDAALDGNVLTLGILWMLVTVFVVGVLLVVGELAGGEQRPTGWWGRSLGICAALAGGVALVYALSHAGGLAPPVNPLGLFSGLLALLALVSLALAAALYGGRESGARWIQGPRTAWVLVLLVAALALSHTHNIMPVRADMVYKQGVRYDGEENWQQAAELYETAVQMAPYEDYYWLFAGRAHLEYAKTVKDPEAREEAFQAALERLERARELAPLNTDHTANLARTYRTWAELTQDAALRQERFAQALALYEEAVSLSPQNAQLYNEWGQTFALLGDTKAAREMYERSLALDDRYANTYMLLGDLHYQKQEWAEMIRYYERAVELSPNAIYAWSRLAFAYAQIEEWDQAIEATQRILEMLPDDYGTLKNLVYLYSYAGEYDQALHYLELALRVASPQEVEALHQMGQQLAEQLAQPNP